jgi:ketosteroid isomerase-like protein
MAATAPEVMDAYARSAKGEDGLDPNRLLSQDIVLRIHGRSRWAGEHRGRDAFDEFVAMELHRNWDVDSVEDHMASDSNGVMFFREHASYGGKEVVLRRVCVFAVSDGEITELEIYDDDQYGVDELFDAAD